MTTALTTHPGTNWRDVDAAASDDPLNPLFNDLAAAYAKIGNLKIALTIIAYANPQKISFAELTTFARQMIEAQS